MALYPKYSRLPKYQKAGSVNVDKRVQMAAEARGPECRAFGREEAMGGYGAVNPYYDIPEPIPEWTSMVDVTGLRGYPEGGKKKELEAFNSSVDAQYKQAKSMYPDLTLPQFVAARRDAERYSNLNWSNDIKAAFEPRTGALVKGKDPRNYSPYQRFYQSKFPGRYSITPNDVLGVWSGMPGRFSDYEKWANIGYTQPTEKKEGGGIPERYKNMGFSSTGQKKQSSRPGKKWMVLAKKGDDYKVVHGGYKGMQDFSQHGSQQRKENFWNRMGGKDSAKATDPFSPLYWHKRFGTWQDGGAAPMNNSINSDMMQQPTQEQQMIMSQIIQALQSGVPAEKILSDLVQNGIPEEIALQYMEAVNSMMEQQGGQEAAQPEPMMARGGNYSGTYYQGSYFNSGGSKLGSYMYDPYATFMTGGFMPKAALGMGVNQPYMGEGLDPLAYPDYPSYVEADMDYQNAMDDSEPYNNPVLSAASDMGYLDPAFDVLTGEGDQQNPDSSMARRRLKAYTQTYLRLPADDATLAALATKLGISNYTGTPEQDTKILDSLLRAAGTQGGVDQYIKEAGLTQAPLRVIQRGSTPTGRPAPRVVIPRPGSRGGGGFATPDTIFITRDSIKGGGIDSTGGGGRDSTNTDTPCGVGYTKDFYTGDCVPIGDGSGNKRNTDDSGNWFNMPEWVENLGLVAAGASARPLYRRAGKTFDNAVGRVLDRMMTQRYGFTPEQVTAMKQKTSGQPAAQPATQPKAEPKAKPQAAPKPEPAPDTRVRPSFMEPAKRPVPAGFTPAVSDKAIVEGIMGMDADMADKIAEARSMGWSDSEILKQGQGMQEAAVKWNEARKASMKAAQQPAAPQKKAGTSKQKAAPAKQPAKPRGNAANLRPAVGDAAIFDRIYNNLPQADKAYIDWELGQRTAGNKMSTDQAKKSLLKEGVMYDAVQRGLGVAPVAPTAPTVEPTVEAPSRGMFERGKGFIRGLVGLGEKGRKAYGGPVDYMNYGGGYIPDYGMAYGGACYQCGGAYEDGGGYDNPGFRALPDYVQEKIMRASGKAMYGMGMAYGGVPRAQIGLQKNPDSTFGEYTVPAPDINPDSMYGEYTIPAPYMGSSQPYDYQNEFRQLLNNYKQPYDYQNEFRSLMNQQRLMELNKTNPQYMVDPQTGRVIMKQKKGGIYINPANKGKFTAKAKAAGMGVQEYARKVMSAPEGRYPAATRRQANFAKNAAGWRHQMGGMVGQEMNVTPDQLQMLRDGGYEFEILR